MAHVISSGVPDRDGRTALHRAAAGGDSRQVAELIEAGAAVDLADNSGWTPLHFAAQASDPGACLMLIEAGARVDPLDSHGNTPLWRAIFNSRGNGGTIAVLRAHAADPWSKNLAGRSPVDLARTIANYDVAQFFADLPEN